MTPELQQLLFCPDEASWPVFYQRVKSDFKRPQKSLDVQIICKKSTQYAVPVSPVDILLATPPGHAQLLPGISTNSESSDDRRLE